MNNYGFTGRKLTEQLKEDTIRKGGLVQIRTPVLLCHVGNELESVRVEIGGYNTLLFYNKDREDKNKTDRENKRFRTMKHQIKRLSYCSIGEDFPSPEMTFSIRKEKYIK